jgi:hypothetical protein
MPPKGPKSSSDDPGTWPGIRRLFLSSVQRPDPAMENLLNLGVSLVSILFALR